MSYVMSFVLSYPAAVILPACCLLFSFASAETSLDAGSLMNKLESAYAAVKDYQTDVVVSIYEGAGSSETQKFLYTFRKPEWIRLDFEAPHPGAVLVYPDKNGKAVVRPGGVAHFLKFHLSLENRLIKVPSGQRIDQTDLGFLIRNISRSLTDQRKGPAEFAEEDGYIRISVLAVNHFRKGTVTLYRFLIDKSLWLPVKVEESTPEGRPERTVTFQNLRMNIGVPDSFFQID
jgi:outer membrane lipoprotein-sorting protein